MTGKIELLLAEDEEIIAELISTTLRDAGFEVTVVNSGSGAIAALERDPKRFGGLITDIRMTGADGWEVGRRARELAADVPVVYMSGDSKDQWIEHGVPRSLMIAKPFPLNEVVVAVSSLLDEE